MQNFTRIVTVVDTYPCRSETFIEREIRELVRQGMTVEVASLRGEAPHRLPERSARALRHALLRANLHRPRHCLALLRHAGQAAVLAERLRIGPPARVLAQFAWTPADVSRVAAALAKVPFHVRVHAWDVFAQAPRSLRRRLDSAVSVLPCNAAAAAAARDCGYPPARVKLVHHGLPLDDPAWNWRAPGSSARMVGIGRLVPKKGVRLLLDACARMRRDGAPVDLEWIGEGPEAERLHRHAGALGLHGQVRFVGALSPAETRDRLRGAGLLVLPSVRLADGDRDGIANVLLEAMALGVPVVTTSGGCAGEVVVDGVNGLLVPSGEPAVLAAAMRRCLDSLPLRRSLASAARSTVERDFDLARNVAALREALESSPAPA